MHHGKSYTKRGKTMGQPVPALTISFIKEEGPEPSPVDREGVCPKDMNRELVSGNRGLVAEGSASQITFRGPRNYQSPCILGRQHSNWVIRLYKFFKIQNCPTS